MTTYIVFNIYRFIFCSVVYFVVSQIALFIAVLCPTAYDTGSSCRHVNPLLKFNTGENNSWLKLITNINHHGLNRH